MDGRRYSDGLHQAIEAKEDVKIEAWLKPLLLLHFKLLPYVPQTFRNDGYSGNRNWRTLEIYKLDG